MSKIPHGYEHVLQETCGDCLYFRQHYAASAKRQLWALWYGHCGHSEVKKPPPGRTCKRRKEKAVPAE